jgi:histidine phosphotransfer protein HptB
LNHQPDDLIDWKTFTETRNLLGAGFVRILGYFREDGTKSVAAHTLKGESWQFGADKLAILSEEIEVAARHYVEIHQDPSELVEKIVQLRPIFEATLAALEAEASPLVDRKPVTFGQRNALGGMSYG